MTAKTPEEEAEEYLAGFASHPGLAFTPSALKHFRALLHRITTLKDERDDAWRWVRLAACNLREIKESGGKFAGHASSILASMPDNLAAKLREEAGEG